MKAAYVLLLTSFAACWGCRGKESTLLASAPPAALSSVVFGSDGEIQHITNSAGEVIGKAFPILEHFRLTDSATVSNLWCTLTPVPRGGDAGSGGTFSGVLAWVFFLDSRSNVLAQAMVVCYDSAVLTGDGKDFMFRDGALGHWTTNWSSSVGVHRPAFCREVLDLMWSNAPTRVARMESLYRNAGTTLEQQFFVRGTDRKYMRTNRVYEVYQEDRAERLLRLSGKLGGQE